MASITIRFIKNTGLVSAAVAFLTDSLWSHCEVGTPEGTWLGAHAGMGVQELPANWATPVRDYRYAVPCTDAQLAAMLAWGRSKIGVTDYDYSDIFGILIHNRKIHHLGDDDCSEFVYTMTALNGLPMLNCAVEFAYLVTPRDLHLSGRLRGHLLPGAIG
jgi:hypothetical protein